MTGGSGRRYLPQQEALTRPARVGMVTTGSLFSAAALGGGSARPTQGFAKRQVCLILENVCRQTGRGGDRG